ncbi:hypothetical protein [Pseudomonas phage vB_PseuGesM_254]|uniref:Uncharacterized protein n=1 Tax=Pseudomonas phage vB_PseuGesM_254 TaxID=3092638 RepID=A0AAX4G6G6_9CAUD|nr:hypothetical protein [Pseudomonas phage PseuGes_254]
MSKTFEYSGSDLELTVTVLINKIVIELNAPYEQSSSDVTLYGDEALKFIDFMVVAKDEVQKEEKKSLQNLFESKCSFIEKYEGEFSIKDENNNYVKIDIATAFRTFLIGKNLDFEAVEGW